MALVIVDKHLARAELDLGVRALEQGRERAHVAERRARGLHQIAAPAHDVDGLHARCEPSQAPDQRLRERGLLQGFELGALVAERVEQAEALVQAVLLQEHRGDVLALGQVSEAPERAELDAGVSGRFQRVHQHGSGVTLGHRQPALRVLRQCLQDRDSQAADLELGRRGLAVRRRDRRADCAVAPQPRDQYRAVFILATFFQNLQHIFFHGIFCDPSRKLV